MGNTANCGDGCQVECPQGQEAWCQYQCDGEGKCVCRGGCTQTSSSGFLLPEAMPEIFETLKDLFPEIPIDPLGPFVLTYPKMHLWQLAYLLSAVSPQEVYFPASRALEEMPAFEGAETTYSELLERFDLQAA